MRNIKMMLLSVVAAIVGFGPLSAQGDAGTYLSGRAAFYAYDFNIAARKLTQSFAQGHQDEDVIDWIMMSHVAAGDFDAANVFVPQREKLNGSAGEIGSLVALSQSMRSTDSAKLDETLARQAMQGPLIPLMMSAWNHVQQGQLETAITTLHSFPDAKGPLAPYLAYMQGLMIAVGKSPQEAVGFFQTPKGISALEIPQAFQAFMVFSALAGEYDIAQEMLSKITVNEDPLNIELFAAIAEKRIPNLPVIDTAQKGMAEFLSILAARLTQDFDPLWRLIFVRSAQFISPEHVPSQIIAGDLLAQMGKFDLAVSAYDVVSLPTPYYFHAQSGRADAQIAAREYDAASQTLIALGDHYTQNALLQARLGDVYRRQDKFDLGELAYSQAIDQSKADSVGLWQFYFSRGITRERQGKWPQAEEDMRKSLDLNPDNPDVLNYLGYSMLEQGGAYDEALTLIEKAVQQAPNQGHIIDSLAWAHYRLGQYEKAVEPMERAAELMSFDPIVNDHLGDVYFQVGRVREAVVQWKRALSLDPEPEEADKIRTKIELKALPEASE